LEICSAGKESKCYTFGGKKELAMYVVTTCESGEVHVGSGGGGDVVAVFCL
jgi:hypothetical protein